MKRYIIGFGNYSKNDDGIGLRVIEHIVENELDMNFEAIEAGNDGMKLLTFFDENTERIVVVDCALMGMEPGDFVVFRPEDAVTRKLTAGISTHEGDLLRLIELGRQMGCHIPDISILAVEPESLDMDMALSATLESRLPEYARRAVETVMV